MARQRKAAPPKAAPSKAAPPTPRAPEPQEAPYGVPGLVNAWAYRRLLLILVLLSGLLLGLAVPGRRVPYAWPVYFVPLLLALDLALRRPGLKALGRWLRVLGCCWPVGVMMGLISGDWVVNTSYVFGGLSLPMAYAVAVLGYGTLIGLEVFFFIGVPFHLGAHYLGRRKALALPLFVLWATAFQAIIPRFLFWTYGELMEVVPALVQAADTLGSAGLDLLLLPLHWVLFAWLRRLYAPQETARRPLLWLSAGVALALALDYGYGTWRMADLAGREAQGPAVQLVGIQPDFSLKDLASNPALSPSARQDSLEALIGDSNRALERGVSPGLPVVVVWPESVYPAAYFDAVPMRQAVESWAGKLGVHLVLATQDNRFEPGPDGRPQWRPYGAAVHVSPADGAGQSAPEVYHKIGLIPFGEFIPFADWIPFYRTLLKAWIPRISEFARGREPVAFHVAPGIRLAPMICFDATTDEVAQGMAARGATVGLVMANLAWFGRTTVSTQFQHFVGFRAIENRIPILVVSQNGESVLYNDRGQPASERLGQFVTGALSLEVHAAQQQSFFTRYGRMLYGGYLAALALLLAAALWTGKPRGPKR